MKSIQSKSLLTLIIIFFIIGFSTSAKNLFSFKAEMNPDSHTVPIDTIATDVNLQSTLVRNPDWVTYPVSLEDHREESMDYVKHYSRSEREYIIHMFHKGKSFLPRAADIFDKYDIPEELKVLPALESNFSGSAVSRAGAVGYWQFMSELGREYGLKINSKTDERKNFTKSTLAAAKFFRDQLDNYKGDLLLTVASYNCGPGGVKVAMRKSGISHPDFWDIKKYLPNETRLFVMRFIALNVISANYDKFLKRKLNFNEPPLIQLADADSTDLNNSLTRNSL
ncbi:MAG: lytic transglycosylase domain-containing protein [Ginsengibacter sp.]